MNENFTMNNDSNVTPTYAYAINSKNRKMGYVKFYWKWCSVKKGVLTNFEKETRQDNACAWVSFLM